MNKPVDLTDILQDVIKGADLYWHGSFCYYKHYEIVAVFGRDRVTTLWVRQSMPDDRSNRWLLPEDPNFFQQLEAAVAHAKKVVDDTEDTKRALDDIRKYATGAYGADGKPAAGLFA